MSEAVKNAAKKPNSFSRDPNEVLRERISRFKKAFEAQCLKHNSNNKQ